MAALLRRVTSLGQLILQFLRCVIFHREKDNELELQRKISAAKEETFFDICGFKESDEHSTTDRECGASKGRGQALAVEKKSRKRKKKRFGKNKISPAEKIAWEECDEENAKKSHAPLTFTSRSSKASNLKSDFSKSSQRDNYNGKLYQQSFSCQNQKEKIRAPIQTTDDGYYGQKDFLAWKKNKSENPGSSAWHDNDSDVNPSSGSVDAQENFKFPFSLWSKVSWKNVLEKSKGKTTEYCTERCTANDDLCEQGVIQGDTESKQSSPHDLHGPERSGSCEFIEEALTDQGDRRSKFPLRWKKKRKTKNSGIGQLHPGFQNLKKSLDRPNSIRSKLLNKWTNVRHRERKGSEKDDSCENVQGIEVVAASVRELSDSVNTKKQNVDCLEPPLSSSSDKKEHLDDKSDSWRKLALRWRRGKKAEKPGIERLHPGFQNLRKTLEKQNNVRSRIVQNVGKVLQRMDKGLQEIGVAENQMMKEDLETTHNSSAGSGEQPRVRPISEMAFRRKPQKTGVERLYPGFQNLKKNLDHPNSLRSKIEKGLRHLRGGTKAKRSEKEESEVQLKIPIGKDKSLKSGSQQLYTGLENLRKV